MIELKKSLAVSNWYLETEAANPLSPCRFGPRMEKTGGLDVHRETFRSLACPSLLLERDRSG